MVVPIGSSLADEFLKPSIDICFSVSRTKTSDVFGASTTENHGISPSQYSGIDVLGVPPPMTVIVSVKGNTLHPFGTVPRSDSSKLSGNKAAVAASIPSGWRPSALARTGSKSTNQDLNSAWAMASRVALVSRRRTIRSSRVSKKSAILFCSSSGGSRTSCCLNCPRLKPGTELPMPLSRAVAEAECNTVTGLKQVHHAATPLPLS
ncbi:hypothetical protein PAERUG_P59_Wales_1_VIM_2_09_13_00008 [Pseudomonas aeruginosa]|nr:hypothetical protein PAERUG_P59_Wales_1_VIM_2_09_13_00008 [Pseudomonas aeruginosa]